MRGKNYNNTEDLSYCSMNLELKVDTITHLLT